MYLNVVELAESFGVEESLVQSWVRDDGLPHVPDRGRLLFDRAQVVEWAAQSGRATHAGFLASESSHPLGRRRLQPLLRVGGIWRDLACAEVFGVMERVLDGLPSMTAGIRQVLRQRLRAPRAITWAPVGNGLALPHLRAPVALGPGSGALSILLLRGPLLLTESAPDQKPVTRLLFFLAPSPRAHLELLGQLSAALMREDLRRLLLEAAPDEQLFAAFSAADSGSVKEGVT
jgi:nitrogen PTS system EIIA component